MDENLTGEASVKITLIENFRALFYAPFYAAAELGAYEAEGLDVEMIMPATSAETNRILAAGGAEIAWGGPMRLMLARDADPGSRTVAFCEVVGRDPFFLLGRRPKPDFRMQDLLGKTVATVTEVPTPWICLQHDLRTAGIDRSSITRAPPRTMNENAAALRAGEVDVIQVFHPIARTLIDEGAAHLWYSAASRGPACYTTLNTTRDFIGKCPQVVLGVTRAVYRTQKWIASHDGHALAQTVAAYLPEIETAVLVACCDEYKARGVWSKVPRVQRTGIEWKRDAMLSSGSISARVDYEDYVDARFAEEVMRENPPPVPYA